ncbi:MAG: 50S ribosomal protein L1 [Candidatus Nezhaarchaeales archaeon]
MSASFNDLVKAVKEARDRAEKRNFEQSFELIVVYEGLNLKDPANKINEVLVLPNPLQGKEAKVCIFAEGDLALKAREVKADLVLGKADIQKCQADKKYAKKLANDYDFFLAQADLMPIIGRTLGPYLGPRGKMPIPITLGSDLAGLISKCKKSIRVRIKNNPIVQCKIGVESMEDERVAENAKTVLDLLREKIKHPAKIKSIYVKLTMGSPVKVPISGKGG